MNSSPNVPSTALVLVDHGSKLAVANELLGRIAERLRNTETFGAVEVAHMELAEPTLEDAFAKCVASGAKQIVIVPYFLAQGAHVTNDIPRLAEHAAASHPGVVWILAEPLGFDERIVQVVADRAGKALLEGMGRASV